MFYAYMRVSTQTQADNNGTQMQKDVIEKYCKENNIELTAEYEDLGISGTIVDRDGIMDLLSVLKDGDKVIVQNTSRLWRSDIAKVMIRREIQKAGADIVSVEQPTYSVNITDPNDFLINGMMELLDQYDRMNTTAKLRKGRKAKAKSGNKACGKVPYGYKWTADAKVEIDYNNNLVVVDIYEKYLELKNLSKVVRYCADRGYKTDRGNDFSVNAIKNILKNDFYIGVVTHAGKKVQGEHEAIVSNTLFDRVQDIMNK